MAQGFIILENGEHFSTRWTGYDEILRIAIKEMTLLENGKELSEWLKTRVPSENEGEGDAVFWNEKGEMIVRTIDLRGLTKNNRVLFWSAVKNGADNLLRLGENYSILNPIVTNDLVKMHESVADEIQISGEDEKFIVINDEIIQKEGPGWTKD